MNQPKPTPEQALNDLYNAVRQLPLKAADHEYLEQCAKLLDAQINPKQEDKTHD